MRNLALVVPLKNEESSVEALIESIQNQSFPPAEIILVDGGSTDNTVRLLEKLIDGDDRFRIIKAGDATPGRGRNIGIVNAHNEWIALTDAGTRLENDWLEKLVEVTKELPETDVVYGNFTPVISTLFEKCAAIAYVAPQRKGVIRGKFIAGSLLKKKVWETLGGFPDLRAAEDLMFMENVETQGFHSAYAPKAMVHWQLRPNLSSTFQKFTLYSKHNVWIGRTWDWHYGIARQYLIVLPFVFLAFFLHSSWWLLGVLAWLAARVAKRILSHRYEFGITPLFNPVIFGGVLLIMLTIDLATFLGWAQAVLNKDKN